MGREAFETKQIEAASWPKNLLLPILLSLLLYGLLAFSVQRTQFDLLLAGWTLLWLLFGYLYYRANTLVIIKFLLFAGLSFRFALLFALPNLSDDFYRFIWDGRLWCAGTNAFFYTPTMLTNGCSETANAYAQSILGANNSLSCALYTQLNSPNYFTIYPPVCQAIFALSAYLGGQSVWLTTCFLKAHILLFESGTLYLLWRLCGLFHVSKKAVLLYALNPSVIIELAGNLHFEAAMSFFSLLFLHSLSHLASVSQNHTISRLFKDTKTTRYTLLSALSLALAVCSKLLPLLFVPLLYRRMSRGAFIQYVLLVALFVLLCFVPILDEQVWRAMTQSGSLYFGHFEFNASIYYLIRALGYRLWGYNIIAQASIFLAISIGMLVLAISVYEPKTTIWHLPTAMLWVLSIYMLASPIVHPWYIMPLVAFGVLTPYRYPLCWSAMTMLSYHAYRSVPPLENGFWVATAYIIVLGFMVLEKRWLLSK